MLVTILLGLFLISGFLADDRPIVNTKNGLIRGTFKTSKYNQKQYAAFEGIPYAEAPIGNLRFEPPVPKQKWDGIWDASLTHKCLQLIHQPSDNTEIQGTEDCLYINVYSPRIENKEPALDVIVHIHGGAFMFGAGHFAGSERLIARDVVYVNFNYRLGPLGFLSTEDDVVPGNNGLKDQNMALIWIKENIEKFGGNPNSITITGLSAGGASVHYHYLSPLSKGLFIQGISASGTALNNWALVEHPLEQTKKLGSFVGCEQKFTKDLVNCLRQRSVKQIVQAVRKLQPWLFNPFSPFGPVVEPKSTNPESRFLTDLPYNLLKEGKINDGNWITSVTACEGLYPAADFLYSEERLPYLEANWAQLAPSIMYYDSTTSKDTWETIATKIKKQYLNGQPISLETFPQLVQAIGDRLFVVDAEKAARLQAAVTKSTVYFYVFSYKGGHSLSELFSKNNQDFGVSHADDMQYITYANPSEFEKKLVSSADQKMSEKLINMWVEFAKTGKPKIPYVNWPTVSKKSEDKLKYINIMSPDNITIEEAKELGHRSFWDSLPIKENNLIVDSKKMNCKIDHLLNDFNLVCNFE